MVNYSGTGTALGVLLDYADRNGLNQKHLGELLGIHPTNILRYRAGYYKPTGETLARIFNLCDYFGVSPEYSPSSDLDSGSKEAEESILRIARKASGLTVEQAARKFGVHILTWYAYERGETHPGKARQEGIHKYLKRRLKCKLSEGLFPQESNTPHVETTLSELSPGDRKFEPYEEGDQFYREMQQAVEKAVSSGFLKPREQKIIRIRYGLDDEHKKTHEETAQILNLTEKRAKPLTRQYIYEIEAKALRKLRHPESPSHGKLKSFWEAME
jgi:transcriptional regulator with XRE-family HTH domain